MLAIIIVNYKTEQKTVNYVKQELSKISFPHKIIIVNNSATKESNELFVQALSASIIYNIEEECPSNLYYIINNNENSGFAKGNNLGATFAKLHFSPEYILFTNNDIKFLSPNVVEILISKLKSISTAGMIGPKIIGLREESQSPEPYFSFWDNYIWVYLSTPFYSSENKKKRFKMDYAEKAKEGFHYKLMGSFFIVKAIDFYSCGMMDPNTFLYNEEAILSERMKKIGKYAYYYPNVTILHEHGATTQTFNTRKQIRDLKFKSACYYYRTYIGTNLFEIFIGRIVKQLLNILKR